AVITVSPEGAKFGPEPYHRGIRIENNRFDVFDAPVLWAKSAGDLTFVGNTVRPSGRYQPWHWNREGLTFLGCRNVRVEQNRLATGFSGTKVRIEGGQPESIKISGWNSVSDG
ncbi:MAG TPA: hypothetical protein VGE01_10075, partial [Fimbriimonas sp.]